MSMLDGLLKQVAGSPDTVASLAEQVGLDAGMVEKAVAALGASHPEEGDTVELAAQKTGLDTGALSGIVSQLGGEGALGDLAERLGGDSNLSGIMGMLDRDGDGNPLDDIAGMASGLFGKK
jgi:ATP phosphoribosyltransferase regulatory subunit HisZ